MKFEEYRIAEGLKKSIAKLNYKKPTDIQYKCIPAILKGEDVLAIAQTGTGKTAAFVIPVIHLLQERKMKNHTTGVKCLVMAPTHELALQIDSVFKELAVHTKVTSVCIHGGVDQSPQIKQLESGADIVIATPGRLFDLVNQQVLLLKGIEILVLDEADHMLDLGFIRDIRDLMQHIPKKRQTLFFSATIDDKIKKLAYSLVRNAIRIQISPKNPIAKNIEHGVVFIEMDDKRFFLEELVKENFDKKMLVFVRTKIRAERVKKALERVGLVSDTLHSDRLQEERDHIMVVFRKGELKVLIATDISARGIDIEGVDYVINYDMPESAETYIHRIGRTGRGRMKGQAISFCANEENELLLEVENHLGWKIPRIEVSKWEYEKTIAYSEDSSSDWKSLMKEADQPTKKVRKKKRS